MGTHHVFFILVSIAMKVASSVLPTACKSSYVFISSFSSIFNPTFRDIVLGLSNSNQEKKSFVYIPTATYAFDKNSPKPRGEQRRRARYDARQKMALLSESFNCPNNIEYKMLELDDPKLNQMQLKSAIDSAGVIYVDGGNTFFLQKHIIKSKFWDAVKPHLESNQCVYIGSSAGAIVAGKSIETAHWKGWDDPSVATDGDDLFQWTEANLEGGKLVPNESFFMHYDEDQHAELVAARKGDIEGEDHKVNLIPNDFAKLYTNSYGLNEQMINSLGKTSIGLHDYEYINPDYQLPT
jgi:peptidase E